MNQFGYGMLAAPQDKDVVLPNVYVLNAGAWLNLTAEPIVLQISEVTNRYFLLEEHLTGDGCGVEERVEPKWAIAALEPVTSARASTPTSRRRARGIQSRGVALEEGRRSRTGFAFGARLARDDRKGEWPLKTGRRSCT
jgi:hypothetical protein